MYSCFYPDDVKTAKFAQLNKGKPNKNEISNYRPINTLNTFSKICKRVLLDQLASELEKYLTPFICAYGKGYSTQNVLTHLIEQWRERLYNNNAVGTIFMDLYQPLD